MVSPQVGYIAVWETLEQMIMDFRKRGVTVPSQVISRLRSAKTLINVLRADPDRKDTDQRVEKFLLSIESYLVSEGQKQFGKEYVEEWLKRLSEASKEIFEEEEWPTRFIPGIPRNQKWIRVKSSDELPVGALKALAEELDLSYNIQSDSYLLVYGKEDGIKKFVKKMTAEFGSGGTR